MSAHFMTRYFAPVGKTIGDFFHGEETGRMARNSGWLLADKVLRGGGGLAVLMVIGRLLGVARYGEFGLALAITGIFTALATLGLDGVVVRRLVEVPAALSVVLGTSFRLRLLGGLLAIAAAAIAVLILPIRGDVLLPLVLVMAASFLMQASDVWDYWFQSRLEAGPVVRVRLIAFLVGGLAKIGALLAGAPLLALGFMVLLEAVFSAFGLYWQGRRHGLPGPGNWRWDRCEARRQLRLSWPLLVSGLLVALFFKLDQVLLGWLRGIHDVGIYQSALRLVEIWNFLPMIVLPSFYPSLIRLREADPAAYRRRLQRLFGLFALAAWGVVGFNLLLAGGLVRWVFGPAFAAGSPVLAILSFSLLFHFSAHVRGQAMLIEGVTLYHTPIAVGSIVLMIGLDLLLIPRMGVLGAALASSLSSGLSGLLSSFVFPGLRHLGRWQLRALLGGFFWPKQNLK